MRQQYSLQELQGIADQYDAALTIQTARLFTQHLERHALRPLRRRFSEASAGFRGGPQGLTPCCGQGAGFTETD